MDKRKFELVVKNGLGWDEEVVNGPLRVTDSRTEADVWREE
jgi:hypothetical protein